MVIDGRSIGPETPPYVVAEMSGNHNGSLERAFAIMESARSAGAHAMKLQTYTADTMTLDHDGPEFVIKGGLWDGRTLYDLYREAGTPWEWHEALFAKGRELGITVFSTPFDETAVDFLESLAAPAYKIASFEATDLPLIEKVAATGKPLMISTGLADKAEISETVETARRAGTRDLLLYHCVSAYPAPIEDSNLLTLPDLAASFDVSIGLSDHTPGTAAAVASVALGAVAVEKHFTLGQSDGGPDDAFSIEPHQLAALVRDTGDAWRALGRVNYDKKPSEHASMVFRRSLYASADIAAGEVLTKHNVRRIRPGFGLPPREFANVMGRRAASDIARGTSLSWNLIE